MSDLITTKPGDKYRSIRNPRVYEALRREGYPKEQAARISNAQARPRRKARPSAGGPTGSGVVSRTTSPTPTAKDYSARAGQRITGNLFRGEGGLFSAGSGGGSAKPTTTTTSPRSARAAARRARRDQQARDRDARMATEDAKRSEEDAYIAAGSTGRERQQRRREVAAARRQRAAERRQARAAEREAERQQRDQEDAAGADGEDAEKPKGGGGGGTKKPTEDEKRSAAEQKKRATAQTTASQVGLAGPALEALRQGAETGGATNGALLAMGLIGADGDATDQGRRALSALERGDVRGYRAALQDARSRIGREQARDERAGQRARDASDRQAKRDQAERQRDQEKRLREERRQRTRRERTPRGSAMGRARLQRLRQGGTVMPERKTFQVFKDASGRSRWVSFSSTAFQDRDKEIVSTKALEADCDRADQDGQYGPLRYWHTPGIDFGDCDFNAMHGRVLIESGTFRSERIARKIAAVADQMEISIGFVHSPDDPDSDGVFHHIRRFERSLVPRGRASNRYTGFLVKEPGMATLKEMWDKAKKDFGFTDADLVTLQTGAEQREKSAEADGVAYKAAEPENPGITVYYDAAGTPGTIDHNGAWVALKAAPPVEEPAVEVELQADDTGAEALDDSALTLSAGDIAAIGQACADACAAALGPLVGAMDMESKMAGHMNEIKSMFGGYTAKKDSETAEQRQALETIQQTVKAQGETLAELNGVQPAATRRASTAASTVVPETDPLVQRAKASDPDFGPFGDILTGLGLVSPNGTQS